MMNASINMDEKICMVTGVTDGIGKQTAMVLLEMGAYVVGIGRNPKKIEKTAREVKRKTGKEQIDFLVADLADPEQIRQLAAEYNAQYDRLDVLVNNAAVMTMFRQETKAGLEKMFAVNHLGYFLLTSLLLEPLKASPAARIVNVSSEAHRGVELNFDDLQSEQDFYGMKVYGRSKLANLYFTYELAKRLAGTKITVNALHPGFVATNLGADNLPVVGSLFKKVINLSAMSVEKGAQTSIYLASSPEVEGITGKYFVKCQPVQSSSASYDQTAALKLWEASAQLVGLDR